MLSHVFCDIFNRKLESGTKVGLKPVCNVVYAIFGRSEAQDRNDVNGITLRIQTFKRVYAIKITSDNLIIFSKRRDWNIVLSQPQFNIVAL